MELAAAPKRNNEVLMLRIEVSRIGALTPLQAFGADFALGVPGTKIQELRR